MKRPNPNAKRERAEYRAKILAPDSGRWHTQNAGSVRKLKGVQAKITKRRGMGITKKPSSRRLPKSVIIGHLNNPKQIKKAQA